MATEESKEKVEFIDPKEEKEEIASITLKGILDGSVLTIHSFVKHVPFIFFLVFLAIIYIGNRYHAERVFRQLSTLKDEVRDMRAEEMMVASELMNLSRPSRVQDLVDKNDLGLKEPVKPPYKIVVDEK
jgi:cell division protein FtsL